MKITTNSIFNDIRAIPALAPVRDYLVSAETDYFKGEGGEKSIAKLSEDNPTWAADDMVLGLKRLLELCESGEKVAICPYPEEEKDRRKRAVRLLSFPAPEKKTERWALLCSGGAYGACANVSEAFPVAARLNELGVSAWVLSYRTAALPGDLASGLMPKPLEDAEQAFRFLKEWYGLLPEDCVMFGFSAGGNLASLWGGMAEEYGLAAPGLLALAYPLISVENLPEKAQDFFAKALYGPLKTKEKMKRYAAQRLVTARYPKTYIVLAEDDDTVPAKDSQDMEKALTEHGVSCFVERVASGGHGFGLGTKTEAKGWVERALKFGGIL